MLAISIAPNAIPVQLMRRQGGSELLELIKEKRKVKRALRNGQTESLQDSLSRGPPVVQGEYDRDFRRFGQVFAVGDRESLRKPNDDMTRLMAGCGTRNRNRCAERHRHYVADDPTPKLTAGLGPGHDGGLYNFGICFGRK